MRGEGERVSEEARGARRDAVRYPTVMHHLHQHLTQRPMQ